MSAHTNVEANYPKAAFAISRDRVMVYTTPEADLNTIEKQLLVALEKFFATIGPAWQVARVYRLSMVETRSPSQV